MSSRERSKKGKRRKSTKNPALNPNLTTRVRREYLDFDYVDQLSEKEKAWLNKFVEEELNASFTNTGRDLNKSKTARRAVYARNNARNRCQHSVAMANKRLYMVDRVEKIVDAVDRRNPSEYEDALIRAIDESKKD